MKVLVLGGAVSGHAAVGLLERLDAEIVVYDEQPGAVESFANHGHDVASGEWTGQLLDGVDVVVASPGFAPASAPIVSAEAAGVPIWNEVELAIRQMTSPIVAITGTNGKTTVVELTTAMLTAAGLNVVAAGNVGQAISDVALDDWDAVVLEVSSFQLARTESLRPRAAVILNVAPDHLDWHGSYAAYRDAKARIFRHLQPDDLLTYDADDRGASDLVATAPGRHTPVSGTRVPDGGYGVRGGVLVIPNQEIPLDRIPVADASYRMDLVAAAVAASTMGATSEATESVIIAFEPAHHRRSLVGVWDEIAWVNDSKATNPHASLAAITSYPSVVLIAGGRNKGLDLSRLTSAPNVHFLIAIGEAADDLLASSGHRSARRARSMEEAISIASSVARPGDTVLLSPGCASFDMFGSYGERGDTFTRLVHESNERESNG